MLDTAQNLFTRQNQSQKYVSSHQFSLPLIGKKNKLDYQKNDHSYQEEQKLKLPSINKSRDNMNSPYSNKGKAKKRDNKKFEKEVKAKLNLVLGEMPGFKTVEEDVQNSQDEDFQAKINENKQIIKKHRLNKQKQNLDSPKNSKGKKQLKQKLQKKLKNQSELLRKERIFRQNSVQQKYLGKRTQISNQKASPQIISNSIGEGEKQIRKREQQYSSVKLKKQKNDTASRKKISRALSYKKGQIVNRSINLFDGIQNLLENPHKSDIVKGPVGLSLMKAKRDLQDKIKIINQKLGVSDEDQSTQRTWMKSLDLSSTERHWRKIQIKSQNVQAQNTSFDQELDRINALQERSSICFEKYLEHQKILLQLQMRQKNMTRKDYSNSH